MLVQYQIILNKETGRSYIRKVKTIKHEVESDKVFSPGMVYEFMESAYKLSEQAEENVYLLALNTKNKIIGTSRVAHGSVIQEEVYMEL